MQSGKSSLRFVHTSDWQIGKTFGFADDEVLNALQNERLEVILRLGRLARAQGASDVLVAGDVYDHESPSDRTLRQPLERMRQFPDLRWHLIPGNHDAHLPNGVWSRVLRAGLPDNVRAHLDAAPVPMTPDGQTWLLPAVLNRRHTMGDPTEWMDAAATPEGAIRIGLAHGSVRSFGNDESVQHNLIAIDRPARAGLAYLAMGDWHGFNRIGERCVYSGTPECDGFDLGGEGGGHALVVSVDAPDAVPDMAVHRTGRFFWCEMKAIVTTRETIDDLENRLRAVHPEDPSCVLVKLTAEGALTLDDMTAFEDRILGSVASALRCLRVEKLPELVTSADDLMLFDESGVVSQAAARLQELAAAPGEEQAHAVGALQRLAVLWRSERGTA
nr:DNA repair exonuclease [Acetobacter estunensis]